jgi:hypothetical protein
LARKGKRAIDRFAKLCNHYSEKIRGKGFRSDFPLSGLAIDPDRRSYIGKQEGSIPDRHRQLAGFINFSGGMASSLLGLRH